MPQGARVPQLESPCAAPGKILHDTMKTLGATTKTQHSQTKTNQQLICLSLPTPKARDPEESPRKFLPVETISQLPGTED